MIYWSQSTGGFYTAEIHGNAIPGDAVAITPETHAALLAAQATGHVITANSNGLPIAVDPASLLTLDQLKQAKIASLRGDCNAAIGGLVAYQSTHFQADEAVSQSRLKGVLSAYTAATLPANFYWVDVNNAQIPMTYADLQGLAKAMADQGWAAYQRLQLLKTQVAAAADSAAVNAIAW